MSNFTVFCLGTGCMDKCKTCQFERNWQILNQLPDALRRSMQYSMQRVSESACQITNGRFYYPITEEGSK